MIVGVPADRVRDVSRFAGLDEREPGCSRLCTKKPSNALCERLHAVDVGHEGERRLRLPERDEVGGRRAPEHRFVFAERPRHLRKDVERIGVTRVHERAVPRGVDALQALARDLGARSFDPNENGTAFDTDQLRGDADPHVPLARDLLVRRHVVGISVDTAAHVQPLDEDSSAEVGRILGSAHEHARPVLGLRARCQRPCAVRGQLTRGRVRRCSSRGHELVLDVAGVELPGDRRTDERAVAAGEFLGHVCSRARRAFDHGHRGRDRRVRCLGRRGRALVVARRPTRTLRARGPRRARQPSSVMTSPLDDLSGVVDAHEVGAELLFAVGKSARIHEDDAVGADMGGGQCVPDAAGLA